MIIEIKNLKINYEIKGKGKPIVFLHGWGGEINSFYPVINYFSSYFKVYALDLPGFGKSDFPLSNWGTYDYAILVKEWLEKLNIEKTHFLAHSFGGRIAIVLAAYFPYKIEKLILVNSAGIKLKPNFKKSLCIFWVKAVKKFFFLPFLRKKGERIKEMLCYWVGSKDYKEAGRMRGILVKIVNEDLQGLFSSIKIPTLIVWGEKDTILPLSCAKIMKKKIKNASLVVLKDAGHFAYLDKLQLFCEISLGFLDQRIKE